MAEEVLTTQAGDEGKHRRNTVGKASEVEENNIPSNSTDGVKQETAESPLASCSSQPNSPTFNNSQTLTNDASTTTTTTTAGQEGGDRPLNKSLEMVNRANLGRRGSSPDFTGNNGWKESTPDNNGDKGKKVCCCYFCWFLWRCWVLFKKKKM